MYVCISLSLYIYYINIHTSICQEYRCMSGEYYVRHYTKYKVNIIHTYMLIPRLQDARHRFNGYLASSTPLRASSQFKHILKLPARRRLGTRWAKSPYSRCRMTNCPKRSCQDRVRTGSGQARHRLRTGSGQAQDRLRTGSRQGQDRARTGPVDTCTGCRPGGGSRFIKGGCSGNRV